MSDHARHGAIKSSELKITLIFSSLAKSHDLRDFWSVYFFRCKIVKWAIWYKR